MVKNRWLAGSVLVICLVFMLSSCASVRRDMRYPVYVTNKCVVDLLSPADMAGEIDGLYSLAVKTGDNAFGALAYLTADDTGVYVSLMNDFGVDMGSLTYTGDKLNLTTQVLPKQLKAQYIVCDMQAAFYDEAAIRGVLENVGLEFDCKTGESSDVRAIRDGKKIIERITIEKNGKRAHSIRIENFLREYEWYLEEVNSD